ncbi:MAG: sugar phosphate nucleotidyltransferase [Parachlamydiales bacterium]|jgi:mannose-1-phosphate guanylyltransferase/mannose-6-phosphate isomerase
MKIVILAGGSGKRLWPLSSKTTPKQFLKFLDHESLFQKTLLRFSDFKAADELFVVINKNFEKITQKQIQELDLNKKITVLIEPEQKNTAGAMIFTFKYLKENCQLDENEKVLFLPSDHLIFPKSKFLSYLDILNSLSINEIVLFGIRPNKIETGYGYIKLSEKIYENIHKIEGFVEKPTFENAKKLFMSEQYLWNAGIFLLTEEIFRNELKKHNSDLYKFYDLPYVKLLDDFSNMQNISIDYALLEKSKNILVNILDVSWSDVGSWDSLYDVMQKDENSNVTRGNVLTLDTKNSLIFAKKKLISTIGLEDILIVETEDAIFLSKKGESQKVKELIEKIKKD